MPLLDSILGIDSIERQEELANRAARERFDPDQFLPQLRQAQETAQEGIADEPIREQALGEIFAQPSADQQDVGTGTGRFLSLMEQSTNAMNESIADLEEQIAIEEEKAKRKGESRAASIMGKRRQLESKREAKIAQNRMMAEAEASKRRQQFAGKMLGLGLSAVGGAPAIGSALGINLGETGMGSGGFLADIARNTVPNPEPESEIVGTGLPTMDELDMDLSFEDEEPIPLS